MKTILITPPRIKLIGILFSVSFFFPPLSIAQVNLEWEKLFKSNGKRISLLVSEETDRNGIIKIIMVGEIKEH
ncbi:MAG: hypothetical protein LH473_12250 [Chitinophagales bacterium]|nr:hypothetical protein [Chitinophagales bacterium]